MRLLDLFCGAGGAAMGYHRAGFTEIVGVDIKRQPRYPFKFVLGDALEYVLEHGQEFDAIHASPPCQLYSIVANHSRASGTKYPDLVADTWWSCMALECPWVIENVPHAPLDITLMLCGSMFDPPMNIRRHRIFESNVVLEPPTWGCRHRLMGPRFELYEHYKKRLSSTVRVNGGFTKGADEAMGIDWMTHYELTQAVPPAYTEFIGRQLMKVLSGGENRDSLGGQGRGL